VTTVKEPQQSGEFGSKRGDRPGAVQYSADYQLTE
jgi:hypothetical protein